MKVETVVDEHRARYIHPTESSSDPNATGYFHWIFPTGRIHFLDSFWRSIAPSAPPLPLLPSILRQTVAKLLLYRPCLPFSWKANNNAIHPRIIQPVGIPFNFFVSSSLPSFLRPLLLSLSDRGELFRRDGEESSLAWNIPIEIVFLFVYQEFKLKIGKEIILSNFSSPFSKGIRLSSNWTILYDYLGERFKFSV